jgi:hypothetical protein
VSYDKRSYQNEWAQFGWSLVNIGGNSVYLPNDFEIKPEWGSKTGKTRISTSSFGPTPTRSSISAGFFEDDQPGNRFEVIYSPNASASAVTLTSPHSGTFNSGNRSERRAFRYEQDQDLLNLTGGFKTVLGRFTIEPMATYSHAKEIRPYTTDREFRNGSGQTGPINFDLGTGFVPVRWEVDPTVDVPARYPLRRTRDDFGRTDEKIYTGKVDVRMDSKEALGVPGYLKAGFKFLKRTRINDSESRRLVPAGAAWSLADTGAQLPRNRFMMDSSRRFSSPVSRRSTHSSPRIPRKSPTIPSASRPTQSRTTTRSASSFTAPT